VGIRGAERVDTVGASTSEPSVGSLALDQLFEVVLKLEQLGIVLNEVGL
jgi:hypothetical protein